MALRGNLGIFCTGSDGNENYKQIIPRPKTVFVVYLIDPNVLDRFFNACPENKLQKESGNPHHGFLDVPFSIS
jgi:hypothetical protein